MCGIDRLERVVLGLEPDPALLAEEAFDGRLVGGLVLARERDDYLAVPCGLLAAHDGQVAVEDAGIDHRVAPHAQDELLATAGERLRAFAYFRWSMVRATARWAKYMVTFDDWLEYILRKARRHSGQDIVLTPRERRMPLVFLWPRVIRYLRHKDKQGRGA